jgi:hypothetical protein
MFKIATVTPSPNFCPFGRARKRVGIDRPLSKYASGRRRAHRARFLSAGLFAERCNLLTRRSKRRVQALVCQTFRAFRPARLALH